MCVPNIDYCKAQVKEAHFIAPPPSLLFHTVVAFYFGWNLSSRWEIILFCLVLFSVIVFAVLAEFELFVNISFKPENKSFAVG